MSLELPTETTAPSNVDDRLATLERRMDQLASEMSRLRRPETDAAPRPGLALSWPHVAAVALVLAVVAGFRLWALGSVPQGMFNDQGVELLQSADLPLDHFRFFAPSYPGGGVDQIESLVPYLVRALGVRAPEDLGRMQALFAVGYVLAATALLVLAARTWGLGWGLAAALVLGVSSYGSYVSRILTRNGLSIFWGALLLYLLSEALGEGTRARRAAVGLSVALVLALMSYSSFKAFFGAVPLVWLACALRQRQGRLRAAVASAAAGLAVFGLAWAGGSSLHDLLFRGSYVLSAADNSRTTFAAFAGQSLLLPVYLTRHFAEGGFFIESVHALYGRAMLALPLRPFFVLGVVLGLARFARGREGGHVAAVWILASLALSVGGPSLKTHYALWPFVAWITVDGLVAAARAAAVRVPPRALMAAGALLAAATLALEARHLFGTVADATAGQLPPVAISRGALALAPSHDVVMVSAMGKDVITFFIRGHENVQFVMPPDLDVAVNDALAAGRRVAVVTDGGVPAAMANPRYARCASRRNLDASGRTFDQIFEISPSCS
jgi:hypothetical protein